MSGRHLRLWFGIFVVAIFLAGTGVGLIVDRYLHVPAPAVAGGPTVVMAPARGLGNGPMMGPGTPLQLARRLDLTTEQQKQLEEVFARRRGHVEQLRNEVRAKFEAEQRDLRDEIRKVLTPDQQKRFDEWLRDDRLPWMRHAPGRNMPGRGRGMGGPGRGRGGAVPPV